MNKKDLIKLFELSEKLYLQEYKKNNNIRPFKFAYAKNNNTGMVVIVSGISKDSNDLLNILNKQTNWCDENDI